MRRKPRGEVLRTPGIVRQHPRGLEYLTPGLPAKSPRGPNLNLIVELDWTGNKLWVANVNRPTAVSRLANGHTLVTASLGASVIESDRDGKEVWSYQTD